MYGFHHSGRCHTLPFFLTFCIISSSRFSIYITNDYNKIIILWILQTIISPIFIFCSSQLYCWLFFIFNLNSKIFYLYFDMSITYIAIVFQEKNTVAPYGHYKYKIYFNIIAVVQQVSTDNKDSLFDWLIRYDRSCNLVQLICLHVAVGSTPLCRSEDPGSYPNRNFFLFKNYVMTDGVCMQGSNPVSQNFFFFKNYVMTDGVYMQGSNPVLQNFFFL